MTTDSVMLKKEAMVAFGSGLESARLQLFAPPVVDVEVLIPAYNEEYRIGRPLRTVIDYLFLQSYSSRITVIDNGSVDYTTDLVRSLASESHVAIRLISCSQRGKGSAVRRGMLAAQAKFIGFVDADMATPIETLAPTIELLRGGVDIVVASRRCSGSRYVTRQSLSRRIGSRGFRLLSRTCAPQVADTQCGFKFFRADVAYHLFSESQLGGFVFDVEILALAHQKGYVVQETPIDWTDVSGSTLDLWHDSREIARQLWTLRCRFRGTNRATTLTGRRT